MSLIWCCIHLDRAKSLSCCFAWLIQLSLLLWLHLIWWLCVCEWLLYLCRQSPNETLNELQWSHHLCVPPVPSWMCSYHSLVLGRVTALTASISKKAFSGLTCYRSINHTVPCGRDGQSAWQRPFRWPACVVCSLIFVFLNTCGISSPTRGKSRGTLLSYIGGIVTLPCPVTTRSSVPGSTARATSLGYRSPPPHQLWCQRDGKAKLVSECQPPHPPTPPPNQSLSAVISHLPPQL